MPAESAHEIGREGVLRASRLLSRLLGDRIALPFNAYDHLKRLSFTDAHRTPSVECSFDLGGVLRRPAASGFQGQYAVDVFVEVKNVATGDALLGAYRDFLRKAAVASAAGSYQTPWFLFLAAAPFGVTKGRMLWNGELLKEVRSEWPSALLEASEDLAQRISLLMATESLEALLAQWGLAA
jgi:hypothetical protein